MRLARNCLAHCQVLSVGDCVLAIVMKSVKVPLQADPVTSPRSFLARVHDWALGDEYGISFGQPTFQVREWVTTRGKDRDGLVGHHGRVNCPLGTVVFCCTVVALPLNGGGVYTAT